MVTRTAPLPLAATPPRRRSFAWKAWLTFGLLILGAAVMLMPFLWMISTSLKPEGAVLALPPRLVPESPTLQAYRDVAQSFPLWRALGNSALVAVLTTLGQLVVASTSGYAFARFHFRGRDALFSLILATLMVPFAVTMTPLFIIVKTLGWTNSLLGLIVPAMFSAFGIFLMRQFFLSLPKELEEAATLDGCSTFGTFARVMLPLSGPALATLGVFAFMASWNNFLWPLLIVSDQNLMTLPLALATLQGVYPGQTQWNLIMAGAVVSVLPMILVFLLAQRWVVAGMTAGSVKG
ncbi:carbohydrate ABC transporter permease [Deinococcus yavapaiensis]|uniref:Carbohydrate ABC transporter membrane protein 2 (CUT1 family) n=1 Tax=Deinococcus yavapaiensis KR-236 TaxID=694435 RepID=A0A318S6N0_9DEIO|nr:carbohydrate ABC transporter permease [Deinococcus yavapaiensis]PYE52699.1 carbohydrate ABC transporter membrane protein 2 (CUT1 family) [Deinococcus yavapaiensis KR-236]